MSYIYLQNGITLGDAVSDPQNSLACLWSWNGWGSWNQTPIAIFCLVECLFFYSLNFNCIHNKRASNSDIVTSSKKVALSWNMNHLCCSYVDYYCLLYLFTFMSAIQRKIYRLLVTDFCCWVPISILVFVNFSGIRLPELVYAISAIVLLPINSALNPILYSDMFEKFLGKIRQKKCWLD